MKLLARPLDDLDLVALMIDGVHFAKALLASCALGIDISGGQAPAGPGRGADRERHPGQRAAGGPTRARPGRDASHLGGHRRRQGAAPGRGRRLRPPRHPALRSSTRSRTSRTGCPRSFSGVVERRMRAAYRAETAVEAEGQLLSLARELKEDSPRGGRVFARGATRDLHCAAKKVLESDSLRQLRRYSKAADPSARHTGGKEGGSGGPYDGGETGDHPGDGQALCEGSQEAARADAR